MKTKRFLPLFVLAVALLAACAAPATQATATPGVQIAPTETVPALTPTPTENDTPLPFPGDTPVLVWHREGGIAGFCDDLTVDADGSFTAATCAALPETQRTGQLTAEQLQQLTRWVNKFQSFDTSNGQDATYPDAMTLKVTFKGAGTVQASAEDTAAINDFASLLVAAPPSGSDGDHPQAVLKAREFLATELNLSADDISVVSFESVEWPDRCLGVTIRGQLCAQGVTPGYKVVLEAQNQLYELHTDQTGESIREMQQQ